MIMCLIRAARIRTRAIHTKWTPFQCSHSFCKQNLRWLSLSSISNGKKHFKLVIAGGGAGGCSTAAKFASRLGKGNVAVIEPSKDHFYQPMWTLVGSGHKTLDQSKRSMQPLIHKNAILIPDKVIKFDPDNNLVHTSGGDEIGYEYLVVGIGLSLKYDRIKGLPEAFETPGVCSNYSSWFVTKTFPALQQFNGGNAIFTFPNSTVKCAGAPQKIMYLAESHINKSGKLDNANIMYNSALGVIFGVKKYADRLWEIVKDRNISVNLRHNLIEVKPDSKECVFEKLDSNTDPKQTITFPYSLLHITPPMCAPRVLRESVLADNTGYLDVDKYTLQHNKYKNVFGIGDCINVPTSKTAAAVAAQLGILRKNLKAAMAGKSLPSKYDGYTSCPLLTGYKKCIMAEFDFNQNPLETFPFDQGKMRRSMYYFKKDLLPEIYWNLMLKGYWEGPGVFRKIMSLGMK